MNNTDSVFGQVSGQATKVNTCPDFPYTLNKTIIYTFAHENVSFLSS